MIWTGVQLFFGFALGALILYGAFWLLGFTFTIVRRTPRLLWDNLITLGDRSTGVIVFVVLFVALSMTWLLSLFFQVK